MKCIKKNKYCKSQVCFVTSKHNYICGGISKKPTKYHKDNIWLCLKGKSAKTELEMTPEEALSIISCLSGCLFIVNYGEKHVKSRLQNMS